MDTRSTLLVKWKFLVIATVAAIQGGLLAWHEWMQWQEFENMKYSGDAGVAESSVICSIHNGSEWPPFAVMILSFVTFFFCLREFFRLNADVPIHRRKLKILTRP